MPLELSLELLRDRVAPPYLRVYCAHVKPRRGFPLGDSHDCVVVVVGLVSGVPSRGPVGVDLGSLEVKKREG